MRVKTDPAKTNIELAREIYADAQASNTVYVPDLAHEREVYDNDPTGGSPHRY